MSFFPLRKKKEKRLLREKKRSDTERRTRQSNATRVRQTKRISSACFCINVTDIDSIGITLYVRLHLITATLYGISLSKLSLSRARERATSASTNKDYFAREMYKTLFPLMNASPYLFLSCPLTYSCFIVLNERGRDGEFRYFRSLFKGGKQTQQFCERFY